MEGEGRTRGAERGLRARPPRASARLTGRTTVPGGPCGSGRELSARRCGSPASELGQGAGAAQCPGRCSRPRRPGARRAAEPPAPAACCPGRATRTPAGRPSYARTGSGHPGASKSWPWTRRRPCGDPRLPPPPPLSPGPCRAAGPPDRVSKRLGSEAGDGEGAPGLWERTRLTAALPAGHPRAGWRSHGPGRDPRRLGPLRTAWHGWPSRPRFSSESAGC